MIWTTRREAVLHLAPPVCFTLLAMFHRCMTHLSPVSGQISLFVWFWVLFVVVCSAWFSFPGSRLTFKTQDDLCILCTLVSSRHAWTAKLLCCHTLSFASDFSAFIFCTLILRCNEVDVRQFLGNQLLRRPVFSFFAWWRRHVCTNCTGHLVLRMSEIPARNETSNQQPNQTKTKTQQREKQASWQQATHASHAKVRRERRAKHGQSQFHGIFFCTGTGAVCAERRKSPWMNSKSRMRGYEPEPKRPTHQSPTTKTKKHTQTAPPKETETELAHIRLKCEKKSEDPEI